LEIVQHSGCCLGKNQIRLYERQSLGHRAFPGKSPGTSIARPLRQAER
jgi:hypothetical protein